jgi:hypothetical protein
MHHRGSVDKLWMGYASLFLTRITVYRFIDRHIWDQKPEWFQTSELVRDSTRRWCEDMLNTTVQLAWSNSIHHLNHLYKAISTLHIFANFTEYQVQEIHMAHSSCCQSLGNM